MPIEHANITEAFLHEPKGASTATVNTVYLANGAGSGTWTQTMVHGGWRYEDIGTGTTFTTPTAYTLINVVGVTTFLDQFTNNGLGRLTYTGTTTRHSHMVFDISFKHSTGSGQDVFFEVYKNGVATTSETVASADSANYQNVALHYDGVIATNDYLEVFVKVGTGSVIIHASYMFIMGII